MTEQDDYFYIEDYNEFYKMPLEFYDPSLPYVKMKGTTKEMYMLLYARNQLSVNHYKKTGDMGFIDDEGRLFCIFQQVEFMERLNCSKHTVINSLKELEERKLVIRKRLGKNLANRYYLQKITPRSRKASYDYNNLKSL